MYKYKNGFRTRPIRRYFNVTKEEKEILDEVRKTFKVSYIEMLLLAVKVLQEDKNNEIKKCN